MTASAAEKPLPQHLKQRPAWHRCNSEAPASFQCATLKVPLDYSRPGGKKIDLAISRIKASSPTERHGVLLLNPGGPGGQGLDMPQSLSAELPKSVQRKYDLIGFDPRGVGRSSPLSCGLTAEEENWQRPYKAASFDKDVKWARTVAEKCDAKQGDKLPHITTRNTARDMDVIRAVLGEKKISYLGYSYGTYLGAVYTQMFPRRSDRIVLDSAVDPARIWRGMMQVWSEGSEPAFTRWTEWTAQRNATYKLGNTPDKVRKTFWVLVARANRKPIELNGASLNGDDIRAGRAMFFSVREAAEEIVELKKAADGKGSSSTPDTVRPERPAPCGIRQPACPRTTPAQASGQSPAPTPAPGRATPSSTAAMRSGTRPSTRCTVTSRPRSSRARSGRRTAANPPPRSTTRSGCSPFRTSGTPRRRCPVASACTGP